MKKRFLIICVNYNTYGDLCNFLRSVNEAALYVRDICDVEIVVVDNSDIKESLSISKCEYLFIRYLPVENIGYLGGAFYAINYYDYDLSGYDFMVISNVDVVVDVEFFKNIVSMDIVDAGWLVPCERTVAGTDINPYIYNRPSYLKMQLLILMYKVPFFLWVNQMRLKIINKGYIHEVSSIRDIYAGHGSMFILTSNFFRSFSLWKYPTFMYAEEIFMGELMRKYGLRVVYNPKILIKSIGGVSTDKIPSKIKRKWNVDSLKALKKMFWDK